MNRNLCLGLALVFFSNAFLFASRFVGRTADPHLLFGLSSAFWAGVLMGVGLIGSAAGLATLVVFLQQRKHPKS